MVCLLMLKQLEKFIPWEKRHLCYYDKSKKIYIIRCNLINVTYLDMYFSKLHFFLQNSRAHLPLTFLTLANGWCTDSQNDQFVLSLIGMVMTFLHFGKHYNYLPCQVKRHTKNLTFENSKPWDYHRCICNDISTATWIIFPKYPLFS